MTKSTQNTEIVNRYYHEVSTPITTFYKTKITEGVVHVIDITYDIWIHMSNNDIQPKIIQRRLFLTDQELVMFKLAGFIETPNNIVPSGHTYITGV